ncbi:hypothetical protein OEZ86_002401 [Tetradesmus obliquus]|nr:hypothetical protein OEZ86_002401 [Tetradesmus obliquus]
MEATIVCIDNSEWTRSGDYAPTRFQAQADAVNLLAGAKTQANPENTVGVLIMAGKTPRVLVTPTPDLGKVLNCMTDINIDGEANIATSVQIAQLALKHRQNKNQRQRIVIFAGSPVREDKDMLVKIAKKLKKNNVAVDVVSFGHEADNEEKLAAFHSAVNSNDNSHLVSVPPGPVLSDVLIGSPIFQGEGGGAFGAGAGGGGGGGGGGGFEFGVDPSLDPELALALRVSLEEERARQAAAQAAGGGEGGAPAAAGEGGAGGAPAAAAAGGAGAGDMELDEDALLQQALAMSMQVDEPAAAAGPTPAAPSKPAAPSRDAAMLDGELDDDLQKALALSMQEVVEPAAAAPDASAAIAGLPGVDPNDPSVQAALRNVQGDKEEGKKEGDGNCRARPGSPPCSSPALQAAQLGATAGKVQGFLSAHRPISPSSRGGSRPVSPEVPAKKQQQQQQICTVDEALQLFAQRGLDARPKLLHAVQAGATAAQRQQADGQNSSSSSSRWEWEACPYDLQVVPRAQLGASYCSVTATGIVQVPGGGEPCMHTPVGLWVRGSSMHRILRGLPAFKQLWQGHAIRRWHANVRQLKFQRSRQRLAQQLLLLKLPYLKLLMDCRAKMGAILDTGALQAVAPGLYKLDALVEQQQEYQQSKLAPLLARTIATIVAEVEQMAARLQSSEQLLRRELQQYSEDPSAGAAQGLNPIKIRAERDAVAARHAAALRDLQRLPAFLRLLGLHVLQAYQDLLVGAVLGLKSHLEAPGNALVVDLVIAQGGVALSPSMEELLKGLSKGVIEHLVGVLKAAPRPLRHLSLAALLEDPVASSSIVSAGIAARARLSSCGGGASYASAAGCAAPLSPVNGTAAHRFSSASSSFMQQGSNLAAGAAAGGGGGLCIMVNGARVSVPGATHVPLPKWLAGHDDEEGSVEGGQLLLMMVGDQHLADLRRAMDQQVMRSYREASVVTDTLAELGVLLRFVHMWDAAAYKAKQHSVAQLRRDMLLLKEWQAQLQVVCDSQGVGLLQLQTSFLKISYMAKLAAAQATLAMMLVSAARKECQAATAELQSLARDLAAQPSKLGEFISFRLRVREVQAARDRVSGLRPAQVQDLYAIATSLGGRLPHADQVALDDLQEALRCFGRALTAAMAFLDSRQAGMLALLDRQAKELLKRVQAA